MSDNARQSLDEERREDMDRLAAIIAIQNEIASSSQPFPVTAILARAEALTGATGAALELVNGDEMILDSGTGAASQLAGMHLKTETSLAGLATRSGMTVRSDDTVADPRANLDVCRRLGALSLIAAPIYHEGGFVGALEVMSTERRAFRDRDVHTVQMLTGLAGAALARAADLQTGDGIHPAPMLELVQYESLHDPLTDLPNRALLFDRLLQAVQVAKREDIPVATLVLSVPHIDEINERHGVETGNRVLQEIATRLRDTLRASDTIARLEGDTFAVLLPGANAIGALGTAKKIQRAVAKEFAPEGRLLALEVATGIAIYPDHGDDAQDLLDHARSALADARRDGSELQIYASE